MLAHENSNDPHVCHNRRTLPQDAQKIHHLTRPTLAVIEVR